MPFSWTFIPLVGAFIGWGTNLIAVRMLFRPQSPVGWGRFSLQGVVPKRRRALARSVAAAFEEELLSGGELAARVDALELEDEGRELLRGRLEAYLETLKTRIPMAALFLSPELEGQLKELAYEEMVKVLPDLKARIVSRLESDLNMRQLLEEKIETFELQRLEKIALKVASKELRSLEVLGGILGLGVGLAQLLLMRLWS